MLSAFVWHVSVPGSLVSGIALLREAEPETLKAIAAEYIKDEKLRSVNVRKKEGKPLPFKKKSRGAVKGSRR